MLLVSAQNALYCFIKRSYNLHIVSTSRRLVDSLAMLIVILLMTVLALAYANGANDNFKGVATLFGSGTCTFRKALAWATVTTLAGSLLALVLAHGLVENFKGKGLVPDAVTKQPIFLLAVALGAA